jgi:hypothetical protein
MEPIAHLKKNVIVILLNQIIGKRMFHQCGKMKMLVVKCIGLTRSYPMDINMSDVVRNKPPTDVQQLKAEIAAIADKVDNDGFGATYDFSIISLVDALRQLSAV